MHTQTTSESAVSTIVALLIDRTRSVMELADLTGLDLPTLAHLIESEPVQSALAAVRRITAIRLEFIAAESDFIATAVLQEVARTKPDTPRAAEMARKAATAIRTKKAQPRPQPDEPRAPARAVDQEPMTPDPSPTPEPPPPNSARILQSDDRHHPNTTTPDHHHPKNTRPTGSPERIDHRNGEETPQTPDPKSWRPSAVRETVREQRPLARSR